MAKVRNMNLDLTKCVQKSAWISITVSSFNEFSNEFFSSFGRSRFYLDRYQAESLIPHFLYMQGFSFFSGSFFVFVLVFGFCFVFNLSNTSF